MQVALIFAIVALAVGFVLRVVLRPLHWCFVPASIVGGICGFAWIQYFGQSQSDYAAELRSWPGILIAVVFACMFLERQKSQSLRQSFLRASREGIVVWIIVLGQTALGLLCTWLLIQPFYDVPNSFGMLIETGFAGGHGTAAAMGAVFSSDTIQLAEGRDLGFFMATTGLVFSVVSGVIYVNLAIRMGWLGKHVDKVDLFSGLEYRDANIPSSFARVRPEVIDPLVLQVLFVGLAFTIGWTMQQAVGVALSQWEASAVEDKDQSQAEQNQQSEKATLVTDRTAAADSAVEADLPSANKDAREELDAMLRSKTSLAGTLGDLPLFIYTLFGGLIVRRGLKLLRLESLIDNLSIQRVSGVAMEFLIVAAIATLNIEAVQASVGPLLILVVAAFLWTGFCLLYVARKLLPSKYWFQLGILNYGMSTGTTATGFTLLKIVDKDLDSGAAEDYALATPFSTPFIGGGMVTVGLPLLVLERAPISVSALALSLLVCGLFLLGKKLKVQAGD